MTGREATPGSPVNFAEEGGLVGETWFPPPPPLEDEDRARGMGEQPPRAILEAGLGGHHRPAAVHDARRCIAPARSRR